MKNPYIAPLLATVFAACPFTVQGAILVYEGFNYAAVGNELIGQPDDLGVTDTDAVGLSGTWSDAQETSGGGNDMYLKSGSLTFSNLNVSGNHIGFESNLNSDIYNRTLNTSATAGITNAGSANQTIYFSFLFEKLQNNNGADDEGFALMNGVLPAARFDGSNNPGAVGRHGFAVAAVGGSGLQAVVYDGTAGTRDVSTGNIAVTTVNGSSNTSSSNTAVKLIVGEISFNTGAGGVDVLRLFGVTDDGSLDASDVDLLTPLATAEGNVNESLLNTLNLTRQVNVNYDEVRIGTTLDSVLGIPEPSAALLGGLGCLLLLRRRR